MNKFKKNFKKNGLTVEAMVDIAAGCNCNCATYCNCTTPYDLAALQKTDPILTYGSVYNKHVAALI